MKGSAGTLGAGELQTRAHGLETALHNSDKELEHHYAAVQEELDRLIGAIREVLGVEAPRESAEETDFDPSGVENLSDLIARLEALTPTCQELASTLDINEIEELGEQVAALGVEYQCPPVSKWAEDLAEQAGMFEMDAMTQTLKGFAALVAKVKWNVGSH